MEKEFKKAKISLSPKIEIAVHDLLLRFASIHLGISCVVKEFSEESIQNGSVKLMNVQPPLPERAIGCAYLKHNPLSHAAQAFLELIRKERKKS